MWRVLWGKGRAILERVEGAYYVRIEATIKGRWPSLIFPLQLHHRCKQRWWSCNGKIKSRKLEDHLYLHAEFMYDLCLSFTEFPSWSAETMVLGWGATNTGDNLTRGSWTDIHKWRKLYVMALHVGGESQVYTHFPNLVVLWLVTEDVKPPPALSGHSTDASSMVSRWVCSVRQSAM